MGNAADGNRFGFPNKNAKAETATTTKINATNMSFFRTATGALFAGYSV